MVFHSLGIVATEERDSANHPPDEHYVVGYTENVVVSVVDDDAEGDYPFHVYLRDPIAWQRERAGSKRISVDPIEIAKAIAASGLRPNIALEQMRRYAVSSSARVSPAHCST